MFLTSCAPRSSKTLDSMVQMVTYATRDANAVRLGQGLKARRDIDTVTEDVAIFHHNVADIDTDPQVHGQLAIGRVAASMAC
jgi:hypothetical protein